MAVKDILTHVKGPANSRFIVWDTLAQGDSGFPLEGPNLSDKTFVLSGTYGGATVTIEGSNNNSTWVTLKDPFGDPYSYTTGNKCEIILQNPRYLRPNVTGGDGTTALTFSITANGAGKGQE